MKILFFAHNSHQEIYFNLLQKNLPFEIIVKRAGFSLCKAENPDLSYKFKEIENKYSGIKKEIYKTFIKIQAPLIYCYYKKETEKHNPDLIGIWNGIKYPQYFLNDLNIKKIYFENGFLPDTTQTDCKGVNALNSVPREKKFYEKLDYYKKPLPNRLIPRPPVKKLTGDELDLNRRYIFVPLQVNYDSQIIRFSPWIKSMEEFVALINKISENFEFDFLIKPHPSDRVSDFSNIKLNKNVYFATNPTQDLIKNSTAIITINSSVGIESLLFGKRVITLGEAFYNIEGIVKHAENEKELIEILKNLDSFEINDKLIKNFLGYLYYEYLIPKSWKNPDREHFEKVKLRISQCLQ